MHEQLNKRITALENRPALQLEIQGSVDPEKDSMALRRIQFDNLLEAQKLKEMVKRGRFAKVAVGMVDIVAQGHAAVVFLKRYGLQIEM